MLGLIARKGANHLPKVVQEENFIGANSARREQKFGETMSKAHKNAANLFLICEIARC